jgi:hypothetical protein
MDVSKKFFFFFTFIAVRKVFSRQAMSSTICLQLMHRYVSALKSLIHMVGCGRAKLLAKLYTAIVHERDNFPISPGHFAIRQ